VTTDIRRTAHSAPQDQRGVIARNPFGLCRRTGYWTPADAVPGCTCRCAWRLRRW
jgi:OOP family OmpA-OmpF porin